jgi:diguanylate cyclase (GGDEF)-like protein
MRDHPSHFDPITGFLDRRSCLRATGALIATAAPGQQYLCALWLDVDRFRQINESFGHLAGDEVIARVADRIRLAIYRDDCILARVGSDELVAVLKVVDRADAERIGYALLKAIEQPLRIDELLIHPSVSIGIALLQAHDDAQSLLERADQAMIAAKRLGGARLFVSGSDQTPAYRGVHLAREELSIEADLHVALEHGGLVLDYQPVIAHDGRIEAVEGLMRCHAHGQLLMPGRFIPVAEKTGLIVRLGEWSLLQGARFAARLRDAQHPTKVAINVSRAQLTSPSFLAALHGALICANIDPALLELEITESLAMEVAEVVQDNLRRAREAGVGLSIDDFGTGYSSLSSLKDLPATKLKLDRSFFHLLPEDRRAFAVIKSVAQLGRELGMIVVAEGIETQAQYDAIKEAGIEAIQGFLIARPMSESALLIWLNHRRKA